MVKKINYSYLIGCWKSLKNVLIVAGIPALIFLVDNWTQWIPDEYQGSLTFVFGFIAYFVNNYIKNK